MYQFHTHINYFFKIFKICIKKITLIIIFQIHMHIYKKKRAINESPRIRNLTQPAERLFPQAVVNETCQAHFHLNFVMHW